ncbi:MAG: single-stranded-DNA-specific exonuclease RecJ [Parcubacteria group bacterium]
MGRRMQWKVKKKISPQGNGVHVHPIIDQLLLQRGIITKELAGAFLTPNYDVDLHDPFLFRDMRRVIERVHKAITDGDMIGIFGDHDADGVSSAALLAEGLESLGATVSVYIPDKITEGHGITVSAIDQFIAQNVRVVISVDCGTSSHEAVTYAMEKGIDVIITDHHHAPDILPQAYAIINPQIKGETYPFRDLSGTAVAFKVVQALYTEYAPERHMQLKWYLDVVCVGTIADCVPLIGENRTLVAYGLIVLNKTRRIGYQEMCAVGQFCKTGNELRADTVAFHIAPRINAAGRMVHAKHAYELLRETHRGRARDKAKFIEDLNEKRKKITEQLTRRVEKIVEKDHADRSFIIVSGDDYPVGIIGIIAGRIAEKYKKPTGIFTRFETESRGSFRSVNGVHVVDVLHACREHIVKFGGHEKAAGATVRHEDFDLFAQKVDAHVATMQKELPKPHIVADMEIALIDADIALAELIATLEPFGEGNAEPIFVVRHVIVADLRMVGTKGSHVKMVCTDREGSAHVGAIGFFMDQKFRGIAQGDVIDIIAHVQINEWNGNVSAQLQLIDVKKVIEKTNN